MHSKSSSEQQGYTTPVKLGSVIISLVLAPNPFFFSTLRFVLTIIHGNRRAAKDGEGLGELTYEGGT